MRDSVAQVAVVLLLLLQLHVGEDAVVEDAPGGVAAERGVEGPRAAAVLDALAELALVHVAVLEALRPLAVVQVAAPVALVRLLGLVRHHVGDAEALTHAEAVNPLEEELVLRHDAVAVVAPEEEGAGERLVLLGPAQDAEAVREAESEADAALVFAVHVRDGWEELAGREEEVLGHEHRRDGARRDDAEQHGHGVEHVIEAGAHHQHDDRGEGDEVRRRAVVVDALNEARAQRHVEKDEHAVQEEDGADVEELVAVGEEDVHHRHAALDGEGGRREAAVERHVGRAFHQHGDRADRRAHSKDAARDDAAQDGVLAVLAAPALDGVLEGGGLLARLVVHARDAREQHDEEGDRQVRQEAVLDEADEGAEGAVHVVLGELGVRFALERLPQHGGHEHDEDHRELERHHGGERREVVAAAEDPAADDAQCVLAVRQGCDRCGPHGDGGDLHAFDGIGEHGGEVAIREVLGLNLPRAGDVAIFVGVVVHEPDADEPQQQERNAEDEEVGQVRALVDHAGHVERGLVLHKNVREERHARQRRER
mmetsp:Transcript_37503/g.115814  ORF Transcript_37503/g.115814 Transcript_37503/m.115814 type:complete len:540 (-) Transcript_37503:76-1695(-)